METSRTKTSQQQEEYAMANDYNTNSAFLNIL